MKTILFCGWHVDTTIESFALACPKSTNVQFLDLYISDFYLISSSSEAQNLRNPFANNIRHECETFEAWHVDTFIESSALAFTRSSQVQYLRVPYLQLLFDIFKFWSFNFHLLITFVLKSAQTWMWNVWGLTCWHIYWICCITISQTFQAQYLRHPIDPFNRAMPVVWVL